MNIWMVCNPLTFFHLIQRLPFRQSIEFWESPSACSDELLHSRVRDEADSTTATLMNTHGYMIHYRNSVGRVFLTDRAYFQRRTSSSHWLEFTASSYTTCSAFSGDAIPPPHPQLRVKCHFQRNLRGTKINTVWPGVATPSLDLM